MVPDEPWQSYWVVLEGETRAERPESDGTWTTGWHSESRRRIRRSSIAHRQNAFLRFESQLPGLGAHSFLRAGFLVAAGLLPVVRAVVLADMAQRLQAYQIEALHREKLVSLGTLAAGLMHELHNPGLRPSAPLLNCAKTCFACNNSACATATKPKTPAQLDCMRSLLEHTIAGCNVPAMSSLDQADAEEAMASWLSSAGVENASATRYE